MAVYPPDKKITAKEQNLNSKKEKSNDNSQIFS